MPNQSTNLPGAFAPRENSDTFEPYYTKHTQIGLKPLLCKGFSKSNQKRDDERYKEAKTPLVSGFNKPGYIPPTCVKCQEHIANGGWIGWVLPKNLICIDIEDNEAIDLIQNALNEQKEDYNLHRSNNGAHFFFRNPKGITGNSKTETICGHTVTYRNPGQYVILAPINDRYWEKEWNESINVDLPNFLYPIDTKDKDHLVTRLAFELRQKLAKGKLSGFEDIDMSFMGYLVRDLGYSSESAECFFSSIYGKDYDHQQTKDMYNRAITKDNVVKGGTLVQVLKEKHLNTSLDLIHKIRDLTSTSVEIRPIEFPKDLLPKGLEDLSEQLANTFSIHKEYAVMTMLTIISSIIGNCAKVIIQEGYERSPFLWFSVIAPSGYGKSPVLNRLLKPIYTLQNKAYEEYSAQMKEYEQLSKKEKSQTEKPKFFHYLASDFTFETLVDFFSTNPRGLLIHKDELAGLFTGMNQYRNGKGNDEQNFLQLFDGGPLKVDRATKGFKFCKISGASVIGGLQPILFKDVFTVTKSFDGTLSRFLLMILDKKRFKYNKEGISADEMKPWNNCIRYFDDQLRESTSNPIKLTLSPSALDLFSNYMEKMNNDIGANASEYIKVFVPKLNTYCAHFAGLICLLEHIEDFTHDDFGRRYTVEQQHIEKAIQLTDYFLYQVSVAEKMLATPRHPQKHLDHYTPYLAKALKENEPNLVDNRLPLKLIKESMNRRLPEDLVLKDKSNLLDDVLKSVEIEYFVGRARTKYLIWSTDKCKRLIDRYC